MARKRAEPEPEVEVSDEDAPYIPPKVFDITIVPPEDEDQTFVDANGVERAYARRMLVRADDKAGAREAAIEQSLAIAEQYGGDPWQVSEIVEKPSEE